jgi:hypothetical protein
MLNRTKGNIAHTLRKRGVVELTGFFIGFIDEKISGSGQNSASMENVKHIPAISKIY